MKSKGPFDCVVGPKDGNRGSWELLRKVGQVKRLVKIQYSCVDCANFQQNHLYGQRTVQRLVL